MFAEYQKALAMGQKEFRACSAKGLFPYLPVLDELLDGVETCGEVDLGLVDVPVELIVGTKSAGRKRAFSRSFLPLLEEDSELAAKWVSLCQAHVAEGIRDPIKVYEYMHYYYVQEGHKRVSVLRYFGAVTIPAMVTRILPERSDQLENRIYYEYVDFYQLSGINYLWFDREGCFASLQAAVGKGEEEPWTQEEKQDFFSFYLRFSAAYGGKGGKESAPLSLDEAMLLTLEVYGYSSIRDCLEGELRSKWTAIRDELTASGEESGADNSIHKALQLLIQPFKAVTQPVMAMLGLEEDAPPPEEQKPGLQEAVPAELTTCGPADNGVTDSLEQAEKSTSAAREETEEKDREQNADTGDL